MVSSELNCEAHAEISVGDGAPEEECTRRARQIAAKIRSIIYKGDENYQSQQVTKRQAEQSKIELYAPVTVLTKVIVSIRNETKQRNESRRRHVPSAPASVSNASKDTLECP